MISFQEWFRGIGAPAQRGMPAPFGPAMQTGPDVAGISPFLAPAGITSFAAVKPAMPWTQWFTRSYYNHQRGMPAPYSADEHRPSETVAHITPFGVPLYKLTRRFDRGSAAFAFDSGRVTYNPIGAGLVFTRQLPIFSRLIGIVVPGQGLFWSTNIPTIGVPGPQLGPIYNPQVLQQLLGGTVGAAVVRQASGQYNG